MKVVKGNCAELRMKVVLIPRKAIVTLVLAITHLGMDINAAEPDTSGRLTLGDDTGNSFNHNV